MLLLLVSIALKFAKCCLSASSIVTHLFLISIGGKYCHYPCFTDELQKGYVTCSKSHSKGFNQGSLPLEYMLLAFMIYCILNVSLSNLHTLKCKRNMNDKKTEVNKTKKIENKLS